jgi:MOB kinase activator 1
LRSSVSYEYLWEDGVTYKRPTKLSAPDYVDTLMNWVQARLDDETVFPHKIGTRGARTCVVVSTLQFIGVPFPRNFRDTIKTIIRRLFRVYAHIYSSHFEQICALGIEGLNLFVDCDSYVLYSPDHHLPAHLNTSYRHFFLFVNEVGDVAVYYRPNLNSLAFSLI